MSPEAEKTRREFLEETLRQDPIILSRGTAWHWSWRKAILLPPGLTSSICSNTIPSIPPPTIRRGAYLIKQGRLEDARNVLTAGIEVTSRQGKHHAQAELQSALDDLNDQ